MIPQLTSAQFVEDFLQKLLADAGMDEVSADVKAQMLTDLRARVQDRLFGTVIMNLRDDDEVTLFRQLVESEPKSEVLEKFIDDHIPNAKDVFAQALLTFRNDYLGLA